MERTAQQEAEKKFREVHHLHRRVVEKLLEQTGVCRSQHMTLMYLSHHAGCAQTEIAQALQVSNAAVTANLKRLEAVGLIERTVDSQDNRRHQLRITPKGAAVVAQSHEIFDSINHGMFQTLTNAELESFRCCLDKIDAQLRKMESKHENNEK